MVRLGGRRISPWILVGGLLTSIGFGAISMDFESPMIALLISLGSAFIGYSLAESGMVRAKPEMLIQVFVILLSVFLNSPQAFRPFGSILYGLSVLGWLLILLRLRALLPSLLGTGDAAVS